MLVLSRKKSESLHIRTPDGDLIKITNVTRSGDRGGMRIGVEAPPSYVVLREELDADPDTPPDETAAAHD